MSWVPDSELEKNIYHLAIQNSLLYDGQGQLSSVMGKVMGTYPKARPHAKDLTVIIKKFVEEANELAKKKGLNELRKVLEQNAPQLLEGRLKRKELVCLI